MVVYNGKITIYGGTCKNFKLNKVLNDLWEYSLCKFYILVT